MKHPIRNAAVAALLALGLTVPAAAQAAGPPPLPKAANGAKVQRFATGVAVPTQVAFSGRNAFVAGATEGPMKGGLFVVKPGSKKAVKIPGTVKTAYGVAAKAGKVYVSSGRKVVAYSRFDGKRFRGSKTIYTGSKKFTGLSGLAIGPNGRIYGGVSLNQKYDHKADPSQYGNSVISMTRAGKDVRVVSTGLRQPWMLTFAGGVKDPFVSVLGQDLPRNNGAPDLIVKATPGSDFGFPECNWSTITTCDGMAEPLVTLAAQPGPKKSLNQQSPMGIGAIGSKLYVALFGGTAKVGPQVMTVKTDGTGGKPFMTGFVAPVLSVATHGGNVYVGDLTGTIYKVRG
jgi:glucose/arabinose dehydrogenase